MTKVLFFTTISRKGRKKYSIY